VGANSEGTTALIQLVPAHGAEAARCLQSWETARKINESHLLGVYETGSAIIADQPFTYAALELPDDDVAEILSRRAFASDQATAIVAAAATALESLHDRGLRHGAVSPSNILFIGDVPKLSVDTLVPSDEAGRDADLRQLGATITEMMTGETTQEAAAQLASPLREVTLGCWTGSAGGWTAARVRQVASGRPWPATLDRPAHPATPSPKHVPAPPVSGIIRQRWPVFTLALVAMIAIVVFLARRDTGPSNAATVASLPVPPVQQAAVPPPVRQARPPAWAVIAATYSSFDAAQKRAHRLQQHSRGLKAHVYPPKGHGNRYYVVLGSASSPGAARQMRARVVKMGAPRDTYVTLLSTQ